MLLTAFWILKVTFRNLSQGFELNILFNINTLALIKSSVSSWQIVGALTGLLTFQSRQTLVAQVVSSKNKPRGDSGQGKLAL